MIPSTLNDTKNIFSVKEILRSRGYEVISENNRSNLLLTETNEDAEIWTKLYQIFLQPKDRKELKNYLYEDIKVHSQNLQELVAHPKFVKGYMNFNNTFEWFVGELMIKCFSAFSCSFGVKVKNIIRNSTGTEAGDFDSLVVLRDLNLAYFECKAGTFDAASIMKSYERMQALNCKFSILFCVEPINEYKLICESKDIKIPTVNLHELNKVHIKGKDQEFIYELNNCFIIDMKGNIQGKISTALRINSAKINSLHCSMGPSNNDFESLGYIFNTLSETRYQD